MTEIHLSDSDKAFIHEQIEAGRYESAEDVVSAGLRALDSEEYRLAELRRQIEAADQQIARGEYLTFTSAAELAASISERGRKILVEKS